MKKSAFTPEGRLLRERLQAMADKAKLTTRALAARLGAFQNQAWRALRGDRRVDVIEFIWWCDACGADPEVEFSALLAEIRGRGKRKPRSK